MSDNIDVQDDIDKIERALSDQFDGGPIPERFVTGQPGTSTVYHTNVCHFVANNIRNSNEWKRGNTPRLKEVSQRTIGFHDLEWCESCSSMQARAEREADGDD